jgi:hypothetical protein
MSMCNVEKRGRGGGAEERWRGVISVHMTSQICTEYLKVKAGFLKTHLFLRNS